MKIEERQIDAERFRATGEAYLTFELYWKLLAVAEAADKLLCEPPSGKADLGYAGRELWALLRSLEADP